VTSHRIRFWILWKGEAGRPGRFKATVPLFFLAASLTGCGGYADFQLPAPATAPSPAHYNWSAQAMPVIFQGKPGDWDSHDVLNPSIVLFHRTYVNLYSGWDGKTMSTGLATSSDGLHWTKQGKLFGPDTRTWEGDYIAANGAAVESAGQLMYFYQAGRPPRIGLAASSDSRTWTKHGEPVVGLGPRGSWDERGVADPYVIHAGTNLYMFYLGMDRAQRQRLGVARSPDGITWTKLRTNPVLELGAFAAFDERGLGEPAVWDAHGYYWMLYTGRDRKENRRLGLARSRDGVHWDKLSDFVIAGDQPWDSKVICDPSVILDGDTVRVWFAGGDVPSPDQDLHGQIGVATLKP